MMMVMAATDRLRQILHVGSWPLCEALVKSVASWLSWVACVELPSAVAVWAAVCRFVAICWVTCLYSVGFDC